MKIDHFVSANISIQAAYVPLPELNVELFILDSEAVPVDRRIRVITVDDIEDLTESSVERLFATAYYGQAEKAPKLVLGRQAKTAIPPAFICEDHDDTVATWNAVTTGSFTVTDSASHSTAVSSLNFASATTFQQCLDIINTALAALTTPDVVGLDDAEMALDAYGRVVLTMPAGQDSSDPTIAITFNASSGTVPYLLGLQASGDGESVSGVDVETLATAYAAIKAKTNGFYNIAIEDRLAGPTYTEEVALAAQVNTEKKQLTLVDTNSDAVDPADATDLHSQLDTLGYHNALVLYTEHTTDYPDASADGAWLPAEPGSRRYGHTPLAGCYPSGSIGEDYDLSSSDISALEDKGVNYVGRAGGYTFVHQGKNTDGNEKRLQQGVHFLEAGIQADVFALDMNQDLMAYDEATMGALFAILKKWLEIAMDKKHRLITSYEINLPHPSEFTAAEKLSGNMSLLKAFTAVGNFGAFTFQITGNITP
jgi:hypothetical protein